MLGNMEWGTFVKFINQLLNGTVTTLEVFIFTLIIGLPLGLLVALGRMSKRKWLSGPIKLYILIMRGTPLMLQIIFIYFAPSNLGIFNFNDRLMAAVIAFGLNYAAYFSEIYRGGIESIEKDQYDAAEVLGFTKLQTFFKIIMPQVIKRILPPMSNELITLIKDTVLIQVLGIQEMFRIAQNTSSKYFSTIPLVIAGMFYLVMTLVLTKAFHFAEKKLSYYR